MKIVTDITQIVVIVIELLVLIAMTFVIPWIKQKVGAEKLKQILEYVDIFVSAAEQLYEKNEGELKKQFVLASINGKLEELNLKVDAETINSAIEAAVLKLHAELYS